MRRRITRRSVLEAAGRGAALAPFLTLAACGPDLRAEETFELRGRTMGTTYRLRVRARDRGAGDLHARAADVFRTVDQQLSAWRKDSELARINAAAPGRWVRVADATCRVVDAACAMHAASGGAFDPAIGALVDAWGFGPSRAPRAVPPEGELARLRRRNGAAGVEVRDHPPEVRRTEAGVRLDLSAIAQGHALDTVAARLTTCGIRHGLYELGGELRAVGRAAAERPWYVAVERPSETGRAPLCVVALEDAAIGTSGVYLTWFAEDGLRYGHVLDPRTARPTAHGLLSVSVIARDAMTADALATTLLVLGPERGRAFARARQVAALFAERDGADVRVRTTPGFDRRVVAEGRRT